MIIFLIFVIVMRSSMKLLDPLYFLEGRHELPILGSIISGGLSLIGQKMSNDQSESNVRAANTFTEKQMQHRHQWEVEDLRAAGLNPILSAGGTPSMGASPVAESKDIMGPAVNSALASKRLSAEVDKMKADARAADASAIASKGVAANQLAQAESTQQFTSIKKPLGDVMRGVGDVTNSALSGWRKFQANPGGFEFPNPFKIYRRLRSTN